MQDACRIIGLFGVSLAISGFLQESTWAGPRVPVSVQQPGAPNQKWMQRYYAGNGVAACEGADIKVDPAGNVYVTGWCWTSNSRTYDVVTIKYNAAGQQQWVQTYDGGVYYDMGKVLELDALTGEVYVGAHSGTDHLVLKYDAQGNFLWEHRSPASNTNMNSRDRSLAIDPQGNVYTCYPEFTGIHSIALVKISPTGQTLQAVSYGGNVDTSFRHMVLANGLIYIAGYRYDNPFTNTDTVTLRYDTNLNLHWARVYSGVSGITSSQESFRLTVDPQGNVYVVGRSDHRSPGNRDAAILKYDPQGNLLWVYTLDPHGFTDDFNDVALDAQGNIYATGVTQSSPGFQADFNYLTVKCDPTGRLLWVREFAGVSSGPPFFGNDYARDLAIDAQGNVVITGDEVEYIDGQARLRNWVTLSYDALGNELWRLRFREGLGNYEINYARGIATEANGNVYVVGLSGNPSFSSPYNFLTIKYGY